MGLLDWLFGSRKSALEQEPFAQGTRGPSSPPHWERSERGNPALIFDNRRITVFEQDRGWKFCIAKIKDDNDPFFSEVYDTEDAAKYEALARVSGQVSKYTTRSHDLKSARKDRWEEQIADRAKLFEDLSAALLAASNVTDLRKIESKVSSQLKQASWQITQYYRDGVAPSLVEKAEDLEKNLQAMLSAVEARIAEFKSRRRKPTDTSP
ncbi:hypothetical protein GFL85_24635 [Rhizobium laguerreae]|uniref:hypothetical protein n=1 Tax=Rhizobium laguerreae TaxID=1076926 RepID=UPI00143FABE3|nr:hypothetical protein [Rhizobium laguerreae]NKM14168.1 hypothetical protein [Rhizobium laguerreae]